jgi:hypothetical protein
MTTTAIILIIVALLLLGLLDLFVAYRKRAFLTLGIVLFLALHLAVFDTIIAYLWFNRP